jgi:hypothetical protein
MRGTRHAELIHPEFDRFDWIWRTNGVMLRLVGFNEGGEHIQFVSILGARLLVHELFNAMQGSFMVSLCLNGSNGHGASHLQIVAVSIVS